MEAEVTGSGTLRLAGVDIPFSLTVPQGPCEAEDVLPAVWPLADQLTAVAEERARREGHPVTCSKGCGACCRQMVPLSPAEARHIARIVEAMPQERAAEIRQRFAAAQSTMAAAGVTPAGHPDDDKAAYRAYGLAYFRQGVPCPFLEEESCSIHAVRPLVCREYLVTSPPSACAVLGSGKVRQVPVIARLWAAFGRSQAADGRLSWRPLIDALGPAPVSCSSECESSIPNPSSDGPSVTDPVKQTGPQRAEAFLKELPHA